MLNIIKDDLEKALLNNEFYLCYQPLIDIKTSKIVSMEALIRWKHPIHGIVSPIQFISVAEETGMIIQMGEWILRTACTQLKKWHNAGHNNYSLAVNVSAIQLQQEDFADLVCKILNETEIPPEYLELEITESALISSFTIAIDNLHSIRAQNIKISIDDFGTGYNSLIYLQKLMVNRLKIDMAFVCKIKADINKAIIDTIITLGHRINLEVTAEGVETEEQYEYLKNRGCDMAQGYYFSKPLLPGEMFEYLELNYL